MSKLDIFEDTSSALLDKRSKSNWLSTEPANQDSVWHEQIEPGQLEIVSWTFVIILSVLGAVTVLAIVLCLCYYLKNKNKKKQHAFGIKKNYFKDRVCKPKNPTHVSNPSKGHYLKKTPSPTGHKSPPGHPLAASSNGTITDEFMQRKPLLTQVIKSHEPEVVPVTVTQTGELSNDDNTDSIQHENISEIRRSSSISEVLPIESNDQILGTLHCTIRYSFDKNALVVTVNRCENLPAKDSTAKSSDPYVKLQLLPEKQHKVKTRVMRRTLNPVYDEDFTFYGIHFNQLEGLTLHFVVLSFDRYSRDDVIGEVMLELDSIDLSNSDNTPVPIYKEITPRSYKLKSQGRGEILVSLCYQPAANRITVVVLKARNLPKMDITGLSDPYVKIYLLFNGQRIAKKKTHVKKRTLNPVFNESFVFELPHMEEGLKNISLEFMLLDWDRVTKNEVIGRLELGGDKCEGTALHHWNEVLASPRRQIAEWHKLRE
jgi:hypothetical protein